MFYAVTSIDAIESHSELEKLAEAPFGSREIVGIGRLGHGAKSGASMGSGIR